MDYNNRKIKVLIKENEIFTKIKLWCQDINKKYKNKKIVMVGLLNGSFIFLADLVRFLDLDVSIDFISCSSYEKNMSTGVISVHKHLNKNIKNKVVFLIDDILDTGLTMETIYDYLYKKEPEEIRILTLLDKKIHRKNFLLNYESLFEIGDEFVFGYGIDYDEKYRNLRDICTIDGLYGKYKG